MAFDDMTHPTMSLPNRPMLGKTQADWTMVTQNRDDSKYRMEVEDYIVTNKTSTAKKDKWDNNQPRACNFVLQLSSNIGDQAHISGKL